MEIRGTTLFSESGLSALHKFLPGLELSKVADLILRGRRVDDESAHMPPLSHIKNLFTLMHSITSIRVTPSANSADPAMIALALEALTPQGESLPCPKLAHLILQVDMRMEEDTEASVCSVLDRCVTRRYDVKGYTLDKLTINFTGRQDRLFLRQYVGEVIGEVSIIAYKAICSCLLIIRSII